MSLKGLVVREEIMPLKMVSTLLNIEEEFPIYLHICKQRSFNQGQRFLRSFSRDSSEDVTRSVWGRLFVPQWSLQLCSLRRDEGRDKSPLTICCLLSSLLSEV